MKARNKMMIAVIIFLGVAVAALSAGLAITTTMYRKQIAELEAEIEDEQIEIARADTARARLNEIATENEAKYNEMRSAYIALAERYERDTKLKEQENAADTNVGRNKQETAKDKDGYNGMQYNFFDSEKATNIISCEPYEVYDTETESYKPAFARNSEQAMLQEDCFTDPETGIRYYDADGKKYLCVAMTTAFSTEIGRTFEIIQRNGHRFEVIVADFKNPLEEADKSIYGTDCRNYDGEDALCIIEFVVDMRKIPVAVQTAGTMTVLDEFGGIYGRAGDVIAVIKGERKWKP